MKDLKEKIQREAKRLKFLKDPLYYRKMGLNEYLEEESKEEMVIIVPKDFKTSLEVEEVASYSDTTSKKIKIRGYPYYLEEIKKEYEEYVLDIPMSYYSSIVKKVSKDKIKRKKDGFQVTTNSKEIRKYILDLIYEDIKPF